MTSPTHPPRSPAGRRSGRPVRAVFAAVVAVASAVGLTACVTNTESANPEGWVSTLPAPDPALRELLPAGYRNGGTLTAGTNPTFPPNQFKAPDGRIIGFEVDLVNATAALLGLKVEFRQQDFNLILPSIDGGTVDIGASGFSDTEERQKSYDFVDFYTSGISWATTPGREVDPQNACGLTVAVQKGTYSDTDDVQVKADECAAAGKPALTKLVYESANAASTATALGRADAMSSDSAVTDYAIGRSKGKLVPAGDAFDTTPFGWAFGKGSDLVPAFAAALQKLIDSGEYRRILTPWGLTDGMIQTVTVNTAPPERSAETTPTLGDDDSSAGNTSGAGPTTDSEDQ
ncbi:Glutamine-binding periplasmic protein [Corynebacterium provencense]|uniref:Glutamine-binding periplasmic protein n=1 Tax=Corynebacterium provencense TaxID=1737425 RepID=A0A2Z3YP07_9CORY|nr:ABC transporter substrate-binding protein [Corynebacterium provencense]AWT26372.1 Glutamine-binding periplasmic protein [Corynebacterium provencense]